MKISARIISVLFHPLLFPTYGVLLILLCNPNMYGYFGEKVHVIWLIVVFAPTFLFPVVWMLMMKRLQMIQSLELNEAKERIIPFVACATFYLWTMWMFKPNAEMKIPSNLLVFYMMGGASLSLFLLFFINIFFKVSIHAAGAGNILGLLLPLIRYSTYDLRILLVVVILAAGVIGTARLILNAHTPREIFTGYFVGFTGQFASFTFVPFLLHSNTLISPF